VRWNVNETGPNSSKMTGQAQAFGSSRSTLRDFVSSSVSYQETFLFIRQRF
jgi:hypothetical protein